MEQMSLYYYSPVEDIIAIKTNVKNFSFYGMAMPYSTKKAFDNSKKLKSALTLLRERSFHQNQKKKRWVSFTIITDLLIVVKYIMSETFSSNKSCNLKCVELTQTI